jgi:predicted ATPase/class 3 adenylate cyclase
MLPAVEPIAEQESANGLGELVGADLLDRFRQAGLEAAGQRRQVTVLFVDLSGYTHLSEHLNDSEQLYELVQRCTKMFANAVYKYDGMVDKFTGDGLMALFGAPIAHENNAELAIRAALDMQSDLAALSQELKNRLGAELQAHIGLHSGNVVVGGVGSNMMMNYTAIGDVVNLASRIETAAEAGMTLVSDTVYRQVRTLFDFKNVAPLQLKGVSRPVITHRVLGIKSKPGSVRGIEGLYAPMIGRDGELERLRQTVSAMHSEKLGRFVAVSGEAGIGKSRLISEFKSFLPQLPMLVGEGFSLIYRKGVSYWIFQDMLLRWLDADSETPKIECQERLRERVTRVLPDRVGEVLLYLEHMLSLPLSNPDTAKRIDFLAAEQLRQQIFLAVRDLILAEVRQKPVVLILEDLHWADAGSLELLEFLLDSLSRNPIVIVAVSRSFADGKLAEITKKAAELLRLRFTDLSLKSLSPDQSDRLFSQLLVIQNMSELLRDQIVQRASGIPLYLEEILRMLMDRNLLQRSDNHWQLVEKVDLNVLGVPNTLEGLILTRFDHLDVVQRHILKVASVIGREFTHALISECSPTLTKDEIDQALLVLLDREFILPDPAPGGEYMFKHVLVSDTIYGTLLKRERKDLHGLVAETIEKLYADFLENQIDVLARHYYWSDHPDRALHYLILAGQKAARNYNTSQSQKYFEDALSLLSETDHTPQQAYQVHAGLGEALVLAGDYPAARLAFQQAVEHLGEETQADFETSCSLHRKIGMTYERQGEYDQALECLTKASDILSKTGSDSPPEMSQILNDTGWIYFRRSNLDEAEKNLLHAQKLAEKAARLDIISSIYNRLGGVYYQKDRLQQASEFVAKSLAIRQEIGDVFGVARSYNNLGTLGWRLGSWNEALMNFKRSAELQSKLGDVEALIELNNNLGLLQLDRGNTDEARVYLEEALSKAEQIGHSYYIAQTNHYLSLLSAALGEWKIALDFSTRSETLFRMLGEKSNLVDVYGNQGNIALGMHELEKAKQYGKQALDLLQELDPDAETEDKGRIVRLLGDTAILEGDFATAGKLYKEAGKTFESTGNQLENGRLLISFARLAAAKPNLAKAKTCLRQAHKLFDKLGARLDLEKLESTKKELNL